MAVIKMNFLSRCLGQQTDVSVIIPTFSFKQTQDHSIKPYEEGRKFKTLILLHGFSGDANDYLTFSNIARYAEDNDLAVIMPSGFNSGYTDIETGMKVHSFIAEELIEVCRFLFPICTERESLYLGGLSMGAAGAAKIALAHPEKFSEVLLMSGAPAPLSDEPRINTWFGTEPSVYHAAQPGRTLAFAKTQEDAYYQAQKNAAEKRALPKFYMTIGDQDGLLENFRQFYAFLKELGYPVSYKEVAGFGHEWDFWDQEVRTAIETCFSK